MKQYWELVRGKIDDMSLRERVMVFLAVAFVVITVMNVLLLDPLFAKQKAMSEQVTQQQEKLKALQAQMQALLQAKKDNQLSPLHQHIESLKQTLADQEAYLQSRRDRLVAPEKMAELLQQVLSKHGSLQLVEMKTLPVGLLIEKPKNPDQGGQSDVEALDNRQQIFKHGVQISLRGRYAELAGYVSALEGLPTQMFWGEANLKTEQYPDAVLTLTLYTLSLDKTWLIV